MQKQNNLTRFARTLGLAAAFACAGPKNYSNEQRSLGIADVPEGTINYTAEPTQASGFYECSAVILDFGERAIFAHATQDTEEYGGRDCSPNGLPPVSVGNVVSRMIREAEKQGFRLEQSFALVNAGSGDSLRRITFDLERRGICVKTANTDLAPTPEYRCGRNVSYNPATNLLEVSLIK